MVMHARKPQRISDGYFEKHQAHPYQKYNTKGERRVAGEYVSSEARYSPHRSPNGNVTSHSHGHGSHASHSAHGHQSHHHYSHCTDERSYPTSKHYLQKVCEKERDRDYKSSRDKYTDSVRSPKDKRNKDSERERSNHERSEMESKKSRTSGLNSVGSRSSKFNKRSATSSTLPSGNEWSEHISSSGKKYYYNCISEVSQWERPREWDTRRNPSKDSSYTSRSNHDKRAASHTLREAEKPNKRLNSGTFWNSSGGRGGDEDGHINRARPSKHSSNPAHEDGHSLQDMDISPGGSTPLSENSYGVSGSNACVRKHPEKNAVPPVVVLDNSNQRGGSLLAAALPRIISSSVVLTGNGGVLSPPGDTCATVTSGTGSTGTPHHDAGPPTPTHSENIDPHAPPLHLDSALPRKMECLGSYSSVVGSSSLHNLSHHAPPPLTPSLVNHVRSDLMGHAMGWPADMLEKQAQKFTDEAHQLGCLQCTRVSAELKCARSLVRHTEIQATLQEQKIMYHRQQISRLEELKSQNSFMSEDL